MTFNERTLKAIKAAGSQGIRFSQLAEVLGVPHGSLGPRLGVAVRTQRGDWRYVHKPVRGLYVFRPGVVADPPGAETKRGDFAPDWTEVSQLANGTMVLRGPDNELWLAKPLVDATT